MAPGLLAASLDIKTRVVTWAIQRPITLVIPQRKSFMWTRRGETNDVAVRAGAGRNARAELDQDTRRVSVGICDAQRVINFEVMHIPEPV